MTQISHKVELLAPAGSREALIGAFSAGADAVYLGGERFGARAYADNFSAEEIRQSLAEAHILEKKIYLTANVLTREEELAELVQFVKELDEAGLDGVIVQDIGVLSALHEACPDLPLHASTQISVTSAEAVRYLRRLGVSRVVPARELSLKEIEMLRAEDAAEYAEPIEIEAFIHGAMCYSYSGRCLMSSFLGGRSGNRGRCAGTCRLPYRILDENKKSVGPDARRKEVYPLSMKDMCVLPILPELIDAGIDSFKIEGRMKKPVYAAGVTAIYRKYIDRYYSWTQAGRPTPWKVEEADLDRLRSLYIRTELGTGYYHAKKGRNLVTIGKPGYAGTNAALEEEIRGQYLGRLPARPIAGKAVFRAGEPAQLTVALCAQDRAASVDEGVLTGQAAMEPAVSARSEDSAAAAEPAVSAPSADSEAYADSAAFHSALVTGAVVQSASGSPLTEEGLYARLCKTGDSMFYFSSLEIEMDDNIFLPVSAVNALRREALAKLQEAILQETLRQRHCRVVRSGNGETGEKAVERTAEKAVELSKAEIRAEAEAVAKSRIVEAELRTVEAVRADAEACERRASRGREQELWALVSTRAQMEAAEAAGCACILIDGDFGPFRTKENAFSTQKTQKRNISGVEYDRQGRNVHGKMSYICVLPPVFRVNNRERIRQDILTAAERGYSGILVRTLEELSLALQIGYEGEIIADASLYSWNGRSMAALAGECSKVVCSLELNQNAVLDAVRAAGRSEKEAKDAQPVMDKIVLPVYGRVPMMESAGCIRKTENMCTHKDGFWYLEDRRGMQLPVRCRCSVCANTIYNAVPLSLHQFAGRGLYRQAPVHLCMFTTEDGEQTRRILQFFASLQKEDDAPAGVPDAFPAKDSPDNRADAADAADNSGKNRRRVSGKKQRDSSGKKSRDFSAKKNRDSSAKKNRDSSAKKRGADTKKTARPPFGQFTNGHYKTGAM